MALNARTGWPLVAINSADGECAHVGVQRPDGHIIDITGAHSPVEMTAAAAGGGTIRRITAADLNTLHVEGGWAAPEPEVAAVWVDCALGASASLGVKPMTTPTMKLTRETTRVIEVVVSWDGEPEFVVDVRPTREADASWTRYGRLRFPRDQDGVWRFAFTLERFTELAERWLELDFDEARAQSTLGTAGS